MREWKIEQRQTLHRHAILDLERRDLAAGEEHREVLVVKAPDWINVIPLLPDGRVVLIRQWRFGIQSPTLEIPGGMVDSGEDPRAAAARELEEETGYRAGTLRRLGESHPNPAFLDNRISTWLATDLEEVAGSDQSFGVGGEEIERVLAPLADVPAMIRDGAITHALVIVAFHLLGLSGEPHDGSGDDRGPYTGTDSELAKEEPTE